MIFPLTRRTPKRFKSPAFFDGFTSESGIHSSSTKFQAPDYSRLQRGCYVSQCRKVSNMNIARFTSYVSADNHDKKLISKRQVAQLFNVSMHTIDRWLHDGKLPEPKRTFPRQKWDYKELVARSRLKLRLHH